MNSLCSLLGWIGAPWPWVVGVGVPAILGLVKFGGLLLDFGIKRIKLCRLEREDRADKAEVLDTAREELLGMHSAETNPRSEEWLITLAIAVGEPTEEVRKSIKRLKAKGDFHWPVGFRL